MKPGWNQNYIAVLLLLFSFISLSTPLPVIAEQAEIQSLSSAPVSYQLGNFRVEVKSIVNEKTAEGTRIAAVIRLFNQDTQTALLPDYELRAETNEGIQYILHPSTENTNAIEPMENAELSYMADVNRGDEFSLNNLLWVHVNEEVYPQEEQFLLTVPVSGMEWKGDSSVFSDSDTIKTWGQPFTIPALSASLQYTPVYLISEDNAEQSANEFILLAANKGKTKEFIPDLIINGESGQRIFAGTRAEQGSLPLEPGEQQYLHFNIPVQTKDELKSFYVLNSETFAGDNSNVLHYAVGRLHIALPVSPANARDKITPYQLNNPISFNPLNTLIHSDLDVSLVELHMGEIEGNGYQTAAAKFKIRNRGNRSLLLPNFGAELMSSAGRRYIGTRQNTTLKMLMPDLSYVVNYSFSVPNSVEGKGVTLTLLDKQTAGTPITSLKTDVQEIGTTLDIYPFVLNLKDWELKDYYKLTGGTLIYNYRLLLEMELTREENVVVDRNFSKLQVELMDANGSIFGSESLSFTGMNRVTSGVRVFDFKDVDKDHLKYPISINFYETFDTPDGEVKRLINTVTKEH